MAVTVVAKLKVQSGSEAQFTAAADKMIAHVKANEPGTLQYILHRAGSDPSTFMFYEIYADPAAMAAHSGSTAMAEFFGAVGGLMDGRPDIAIYEEVAGKK